MSTKKNEVKKLDIKDVFLDFPSTLIKISYETGQKKLLGSVSKECGVSVVIVKQWEKKAPNIVAIIHAYLKEYNLTFEELVKEVKTYQPKTKVKKINHLKQ
jgi:antitoxin component HigA of HigAB toxin-antitoxin module